MSDRSDWQKIRRVFKVLAECSDAEAGRAANAICRDPEAVALLATACGVSIGAVGMGGTLTVAGGSAPAGLALAGAGILGAKRFCTAVVEHGTGGIRESDKMMLRRGQR